MAKKNGVDIDEIKSSLESLNESLKSDEQVFDELTLEEYCSILDKVAELKDIDKYSIGGTIADCLDKIYLKDKKTIRKVFHRAFLHTFESCYVAIFNYKRDFIQKDIEWCLNNSSDFKSSAKSVCDLLSKEKSKYRASHLYVQIVLELINEYKDAKKEEAKEYGKALFSDKRIECLPSLGYCMGVGNIFKVRKTEKYRDMCLK